MVSMKDIAKKCGVSVATVSKALNDQQDIGAETKERITKTAKEMGYYRNSSARALKTNRTYNIGVLFVDEQHSGLTHAYFSAVLDSLKSEAENRGYDITFISNGVGGNELTYLQHAKYRGVDGVVIACVNFRDPQVQELIESDIPVVTIDHIFNDRIAVLSDNMNGMEELVTYIAKRGHRRIAFIHGEQSSVTTNRLNGFYRACEKMNLTIPDEYIRQSAYQEPLQCEKITKELLQLKEPPTCIVFPDDYAGVGGLNAIRAAELRIPEDISVAGYDGIRLASVISPPLTTYRQDTKALGKTAASKVIDLIENPKTTVIDRIIVKGKLQEGASVGLIK